MTNILLSNSGLIQQMNCPKCIDLGKFYIDGPKMLEACFGLFSRFASDAYSDGFAIRFTALLGKLRIDQSFKFCKRPLILHDDGIRRPVFLNQKSNNVPINIIQSHSITVLWQAEFPDKIRGPIGLDELLHRAMISLGVFHPTVSKAPRIFSDKYVTIQGSTGCEPMHISCAACHSDQQQHNQTSWQLLLHTMAMVRSEERRVGKECRSRWS